MSLGLLSHCQSDDDDLAIVLHLEIKACEQHRTCSYSLCDEMAALEVHQVVQPRLSSTIYTS